MLHEVLMALAGYPGGLFSDSGEIAAECMPFIHPGEKALLDRIMYIAKSYSTLKKFVDINLYNVGPGVNSGSSRPNGLYLQAFCNALDKILEPYEKEIGCLEKSVLKDPYLPLTLIVSTAEKYSGLFKVLNEMISEIMADKITGCSILSFVHRRLATGVNEVKSAMKCVLHNCHKVFFKQVSSWLLHGILVDYENEFFIKLQQKDQNQTGTYTTVGSCSSKLQELKISSGSSNYSCSFNYDYEVDLSVLPPYISITLANKVLFIGQTILMFRSDPREKNVLMKHKKVSSIWGEREKEFCSKMEQLQAMEIFNVTEFENTVEEIRLCITEHLWQLAVEDMKLFQQLKLIKDFFLLGRGELFAAFMNQAGNVLDKVPSVYSNRDVNTAFQLAAQKVLLTDESALDKFSFSLPNLSKNAKDSNIQGTGWELLSLKYKVDWPLHLIFTDEVLTNYNHLFRFLLHVKKTQYDLNVFWSENRNVKTRSDKCKLALLQLHNNLMFVINNLQYYFQVDVLESQYMILQTAINSTKDFEQIQKAHIIFQANIISQTFLLLSAVKDLTQVPNHKNKGFKDNPVHKTISSLLDLCKRFCEQQQKPFDERHLSEMQQQFHHLMSFLLQLFSSLRSHPCGTHLAQLELRLDFNHWISHFVSTSSSISIH